ncbi:FabD/lysophospholipase-like protein [Mycena belliarum]|uniref:FabD/lysophospholipase-like protein n=1 Tax=Mycena belliarum TaxID=1033014 RepID=A0AAD6TU85_9AGAR|nr:FabD/lysophospholipase-like protein [Mycena belliae]
MSISPPDGVRVLSFDGGGIRGLSSLLILQRIMYRIKEDNHLEKVPKPCEYFDMMCGTSTGGMIALMLGRLQMSIEEAIDAYDSLAQFVFSETKPTWKDGRYKASRLEAAIKKIVEEKSESQNADEPMKDSRTGDAICKTFVCAHSAVTMRANIAHLFRTYDSPNEPAATCAIWQAARATSAAPTFFKRIELGKPPQPFIDGGLGRNNPTSALLDEAKVVFPNRRIACVVSIGTGQLKGPTIPKPSGIQRFFPTDVVEAMIKIATECETTHEEIVKRFDGMKGVYFRFNVEQGMQDIKLEEWGRLGEVTAHTDSYTSGTEVSRKLEEAVRVLQEPVGRVSTAELHVEMLDIC